MTYTHYGKTGIEVSRLGFGAMRFEKPDDIDAMAEIVLRAHNQGVTYFDTAPFYCQDKSEEIIGTAVKEMKKTKKPFYISTKSSSKSEAEVRKSIERSLNRLNVDSIDFFHCWCILSIDQLKNRIKGGALKAMEKAKEEGLVKHIAVSTHLPAEEMKEAFQLFPFEGVTCGFNALNYQLRREGIKTAKKLGFGVAAMNPLGGGIIPQFKKHFSYLKQKPEQNIIDAALNFVWSEQGINIALVGMANNREVDEAVSAANAYSPPDAAWKKSIAEQCPNVNGNLCTSCQYCVPCPEEIPVFKYIGAYNHYLLKNNWKVVKDHLKYYWGIHDVSELKNCTECGACEKKCTQHIGIIKRLKEILTHVDNLK